MLMVTPRLQISLLAHLGLQTGERLARSQVVLATVNVVHHWGAKP